MPHRPAILALLAAICLAGTSSCTSRKPTATQKPAAPEETVPPPDSFIAVGTEAAELVRAWVTALSFVETEESAASAAKRLGLIGEQFDILLERAARLPELGPDEFKRVDDEIDALIGQSAVGLDPESRRIFLLPEAIRSQVLTAHQQLLEKFKSISRAIATGTKSPKNSGN